MGDTGGAFGRRALLLAAAVGVTGSLGVGGRAGAAPARWAATSRRVGAFTVTPLLDAAGPFFLDRQAAFPAATPADWARARRLDPEAFGPGESWQLDFRCFVVRGPRGRLALVDTGVGPDGSPAAAWAPTPGRLPTELAHAGIDPADVDTVVLTHLHEDHFGWSVDRNGEPMFPNARYVVQRRETEALPAGDAALAYVVEPLRAAGQLHEVDGVTRLAAAGRSGVRVVPTPGHTPGHQSVVVEGRHEQVIVTGDVLVHAVQLVDPDVAYRFEADAEAARRTRRRLLDEAGVRRTVLATAHLNRPWVELG
ncbi:MBL fold metallo-hydrolase [Micromonospora globbae]|uniref:MBL fold metallo-hydrolase n=1 Tax=Micromonospora globbae TaxID=1894969 RepID=UPI0034244750|nr:MBL fold metallo-hydrolase [Micromonospora globbae]